MKNLNRVIWILGLLGAFTSVSGSSSINDEPLDDVLNILQNVPAVFQKWLDSVEQIASKQDKAKVKKLALQIQLDLGKVVIDKNQLISKLEQNSELNAALVLADLTSLKTHITQLGNTLNTGNELFVQMNIETIDFKNTLLADFTEKEVILMNLNQSSLNRKQTIEKLKKGKKILEHAQKIINAFTKKL